VKNGDYQNIIATAKLKPINVIGYFGDNIQDFPAMFQNKLQDVDQEDKIFSEFGKTYFAFPNPTYGSWEKNSFI
jgi:predicted secreted acid phosphatase